MDPRATSRVIFIEWVDTHYFVLQTPYGALDRLNRDPADRFFLLTLLISRCDFNLNVTRGYTMFLFYLSQEISFL